MPRLEADAYAEFVDAASIGTGSAFLQSSLSTRHSFFGKENLPTAKPSAALSPVLSEVHRSCLRSEFVRGGSGREVTVLRKRCTVSVPWSCQVDASFSIVVSDPRSHHRRCGVDPTTVSPAPPLSPSSLRNLGYAFDRSRERRGARWLQGRRTPSERRGHPLGHLGCGCSRGVGRWRRP